MGECKPLPPGTSYTLRFEGRQKANPSVSSSVEFDFYVQSAALKAVITGGRGLHSSTSQLNLSRLSSPKLHETAQRIPQKCSR